MKIQLFPSTRFQNNQEIVDILEKCRAESGQRSNKAFHKNTKSDIGLV